MTREDVIRGLNDIHAVACGMGDDECYLNSIGIKQLQTLINGATALLKAQEPVEPVVDIDTWKCGNCGHALEHQQLLGDNVLFHEQYNYCPECGRAVKWE